MIMRARLNTLNLLSNIVCANKDFWPEKQARATLVLCNASLLKRSVLYRRSMLSGICDIKKETFLFRLLLSVSVVCSISGKIFDTVVCPLVYSKPSVAFPKQSSCQQLWQDFVWNWSKDWQVTQCRAISVMCTSGDQVKVMQKRVTTDGQKCIIKRLHCLDLGVTNSTKQNWLNSNSKLHTQLTFTEVLFVHLWNENCDASSGF